MIFKNCWLHFKTIIKHKWYVFLACKDCGIIWRGIKHDLSKFSPTEFFEYANNYTVGKSPVDVAKEKYGYCKAWLHHRGRNTHHWEYWVDNLYKGGEPIKMPYLDLVEMLCDWMGASKAYNPSRWTQSSNYEWWLNKKTNIKVHGDTYNFIELALKNLKDYGWKWTAEWLKNRAMYIYKN